MTLDLNARNLPAESKEPEQTKISLGPPAPFSSSEAINMSALESHSTTKASRHCDKHKCIIKKWEKTEKEHSRRERGAADFYLHPPALIASYDYVDYVNDYCLYRVRESISFMYLVTGRLTLSPYCKYKIKFTSTNCRACCAAAAATNGFTVRSHRPTIFLNDHPIFVVSSCAATTNESRDKIMNESLKSTGARLSAPGQHGTAQLSPSPSARSAHRQIYRLPQSF
jgi:hypothetical protein